MNLAKRTARGVALAAVTVAMMVSGPAPQLIAAAERVYAVAVLEQQRERRRRRRRLRRIQGPLNRRPHPTRPGR